MMSPAHDDITQRPSQSHHVNVFRDGLLAGDTDVVRLRDAGVKPMIDPAFWSDPDIEGAKSGVKLAALWLITNPQTSILGLCNASPLRFTFETGLPAKPLKAL